jgi:hypothetical protein
MANFLIAPKKPRVLILDPNATALNASDKVVRVALAFALRLGCYAERVNYTSAVYAPFLEDWDLILVPHVTNSQTSYTNLQTAINKLVDSTIPVVVMQCESFALNATVKAITGVSTANTSAGDVRCTELVNWENRKTGRVTFYAEKATALDAAATTIATDGTNTVAWRFDIGSHPTLWIAGYSNSENAGTSLYKPWFCFQWMIDQQSTEAKRSALRAQIRKAYCLMRWDGLDESLMITAKANGSLDSIYDACKEYGLEEIWLAASWTGESAPGVKASTPYTWFLARAEQTYQGTDRSRLFRFINHHTDVVDGARTVSGDEEKCTSDGLLFDQFDQAGRVYEADCDQLTALGFVLGSDGYGRGYPAVQNGNDMNNPAALFLGGRDGKTWDATDERYYGGYGCNLWLSGAEKYPSAAETPAVYKQDSQPWNGGRTLITYSQDTVDDGSAGAISLTFNESVLRAFIFGGGLYWHGSGLDLFDVYKDEFLSLFTHFPDVLASGPYEDMMSALEYGLGFRYYDQ